MLQIFFRLVQRQMGYAKLFRTYAPTLALFGALGINTLTFYLTFSEASFWRSARLGDDFDEEQQEALESDAATYFILQIVTSAVFAVVAIGTTANLLSMVRKVKKSETVFVFDEKLRYVIGGLLGSAALWLATELLVTTTRQDEPSALETTVSNMRRLRIGTHGFVALTLFAYGMTRLSGSKSYSTKYMLFSLEERIQAIETKLPKQQ